MVNVVFALIVSRFFGFANLQLGMLLTDARTPIGAALQEPFMICLPFVKGRWGTVAQKLMKLLCDVSEATIPSVVF